MAAVETPASAIGWRAKDFTLEDADGNPFRLHDLKGPSGMLVMFICNHCPYVRAIADRIARDAVDLQKRGVGVIAVMPNDYVRYPEDAPEQMKHFAQEHNFSFPYVVDETQAVARAYDAVCTPDFFGLNAALELQYRGRLDASRTTLVPDARRELFEAMCRIAETGEGPAEQQASMGCSIKWPGVVAANLPHAEALRSACPLLQRRRLPG